MRSLRARDNPFRTERIGTLRFRHRDGSLAALCAKLESLGRRAAIVGPHGSGKTTLLRELGAQLADRGFRLRHWFLNADADTRQLGLPLRAARSLGPDDALLFDGAEQLPRRVLARVLRASRRAGVLLATSHTELPLPTLLQTTTDAPLLEALARELVGPPATQLAPLLEELRVAHHGNLREVFLALYDLAAAGDPRLELRLPGEPGAGTAQ